MTYPPPIRNAREDAASEVSPAWTRGPSGDSSAGMLASEAFDFGVFGGYEVGFLVTN